MEFYAVQSFDFIYRYVLRNLKLWRTERVLSNIFSTVFYINLLLLLLLPAARYQSFLPLASTLQ